MTQCTHFLWTFERVRGRLPFDLEANVPQSSLYLYLSSAQQIRTVSGALPTGPRVRGEWISGQRSRSESQTRDEGDSGHNSKQGNKILGLGGTDF